MTKIEQYTIPDDGHQRKRGYLRSDFAMNCVTAVLQLLTEPKEYNCFGAGSASNILHQLSLGRFGHGKLNRLSAVIMTHPGKNGFAGPASICFSRFNTCFFSVASQTIYFQFACVLFPVYNYLLCILKQWYLLWLKGLCALNKNKMFQSYFSPSFKA